MTTHQIKKGRSPKRLLIILLLITVAVAISGWFIIRRTSLNANSHPAQITDNVMLEPVGRRASVEIAKPTSSPVAQPASSSVANQYFIPVLLYHKTPDNFEQQLIALRDKGYTTITMAELYAILNGAAQKPAKPAVITFDDGFSDQLRAFDLLKKYNMKATFYIIIGGGLSNWCIGAERRNTSCGDAYMNWADITKLKDSGLIEIGSHTIDHLSLPAQSQAVQKDQIFRSKQILEEKLGIRITSFAYPYGHLNDSAISLVRSAGYTNATGTVESSMVSKNNIYNIPRIRSTLNLP